MKKKLRKSTTTYESSLVMSLKCIDFFLESENSRKFHIPVKNGEKTLFVTCETQVLKHYHTPTTPKSQLPLEPTNFF